jgi:hypothetical protein
MASALPKTPGGVFSSQPTRSTPTAKKTNPFPAGFAFVLIFLSRVLAVIFYLLEYIWYDSCLVKSNNRAQPLYHFSLRGLYVGFIMELG